MYDWADVPGLPACDAMAGPGEQSLSDHSQDFCLRVAQTHHSCLRGQSKCFTGAATKFVKKKKNQPMEKNQQPSPATYLKKSLEDEV